MNEDSPLNKLKDGGGPIVLFGASTAGRKICGLLKDFRDRIVFCDNYKRGIEPITHIAIISPVELREGRDTRYKNASICICAMSPVLHEEIYQQLIGFGFPRNHIVEYPALAEALKKEFKLCWPDMESSYDWTQNQRWIAAMSQWIDDNDHSVIDYGAGACYLRQCLRPNMTYIPTDYIARSKETVVFDYNKDPFPDICADVGFLAFSLQQAEDWKSLLRSVCRASNRKVIIGTAILNKTSDIPVLSEVPTHFCSDGPIIEFLEQNGFVLKERKLSLWGDGTVAHLTMLLFTRRQ